MMRMSSTHEPAVLIKPKHIDKTVDMLFSFFVLIMSSTETLAHSRSPPLKIQ